jgi:predicted acetyltransferase
MIKVRLATRDEVSGFERAGVAEGLLPFGASTFFILEVDGEAVGCCAIRWAAVPILKSDYILPAFRRRGFGEVMVRFRLNLIRQSGYRRAKAHCTPASRNIYIACGGQPGRPFKNGITPMSFTLMA